MRRFFILFAAALLALGRAAPAEYQAYRYKASVRRVEAVMSGGRPVGGRVVTDTLSGYLVTVACYPCGASMGKGYESWLFVVSKRAGKRILWRIPVQLDGGMFGRKADPAALSDSAWFDPTAGDRAVMRRASSSWLHFEADTRTMELPSGAGLLGPLAVRARLVHDGYGLGRCKVNRKTDDPAAVFNPYVKSASGTVSGWLELSDGAYGFDPSSRVHETAASVCGTFSVQFDSRLTEDIRGTADWRVIAARVMARMLHRELLEEPYDKRLMWTEWPPFDDDDAEEGADDVD